MKKNIKIIITCLSLFLFLGLFSMNSTEAATQTIKSTIRSEKFETQPNGQKLWAWGFNVKTTNVEDGTPLWVYVYNGKIEDKILVSSGTYTTITNNSAITETKYVLEEGKFYTILLQVPTKPTMGTMYSATVGKADDGSSVNNIIPKEEQIYSEGYNLLAPIGSIKKVETDDVGKYFNIIFKIVIALCAVLAVIYIVIGGVQYMGDESIFAKTEAKKNILSAIFGLLIALGSYALLNTINPDLLGGDGLNIKTTKIEIDNEAETEPWDSGSAVVTGPTKSCPDDYVNVLTYGEPRTINVCKSIAPNLTKLIEEAKKKGYILTGSGSRTYDQQLKLRRDNNCSPDIYNSPSKNCNPETARPGYSKHESGKAVDFKCNGKPLKGSQCFEWLKSNASKYGFFNLRSEAWHWSDDGH